MTLRWRHTTRWSVSWKTSSMASSSTTSQDDLTRQQTSLRSWRPVGHQFPLASLLVIYISPRSLTRDQRRMAVSR
jgi:hypothetical protein